LLHKLMRASKYLQNKFGEKTLNF